MAENKLGSGSITTVSEKQHIPLKMGDIDQSLRPGITEREEEYVPFSLGQSSIGTGIADSH